jgi:hypothetical protein
MLCLMTMAKALGEDRGDHLVLRPVPDEPVAAAVGAFATPIGMLGTEEAKRLDREEELDVQERDLQLPDSKG